MYSFCTQPINAHVTCLQDATGVSAFLVTGSHRALLIDACTGLGDLAAAVAGCTALPVELLLTHAHGDHTGGAARFETVWLSPRDMELWQEHNLASRLDYIQHFMPDVPREAVTPDRSEPPKPLADGQVFDLGGVIVETIPVPGHTPGMTCALVREDRTILFGDACNANTLLLNGGLANVARYSESLERLRARSGDFDTVLYSHGPAVGASCLEGCRDLCRRILDGTDDRIPVEFLGKTMYRAAACDGQFRRLDGGMGNICYRLEE